MRLLFQGRVLNSRYCELFFSCVKQWEATISIVLCMCLCVSVLWFAHGFTHSHRFICVFAKWRRQGMLSRVHAMLWLSKHIMRWELHFPHTNRHQNKQASQLAYICKTVLSCTCKLLSEGPVPKLLPPLYLTSKLLSFGMCTPNYRPKKHFGLPSRGTEHSSTAFL